jgi:hypothetical protein
MEEGEAITKVQLRHFVRNYVGVLLEIEGISRGAPRPESPREPQG